MRSEALKLGLVATVLCMLVLPQAVMSAPVSSGTIMFDNADTPWAYFLAILDYEVYAPGDVDNPVDAVTYPSVNTEYTFVYTLRDSSISVVPLDGIDIQLASGVTITANGSIDDGDPSTVAPDGPAIVTPTLASFDFFGGGTFPLRPGVSSEQFFMVSPSAAGDAVVTVVFDGTSEDMIGLSAGPVGTGAICGNINAVCDIDPAAVGVTVDLYNTLGELVASAATDDAGDYCFSGLLGADYVVAMVTPLGYETDNEEIQSTVLQGDTTIVDFSISCVPADPTCFWRRTRCYWKHQVKAHLRHRPRWARESLADLSTYMELIRIHFNENLLNPVDYLQVEAGQDSLRALKRLLTVSRCETMQDRATAQLMALLLNVVSNKLHQQSKISCDGATVSQAITYVDHLIEDGDPSNDELAMKIARRVNFGVMVPAGWIPLDTADIYYELGRRSLIDMRGAFPNPLSSASRIAFTLNGEGYARVDVKVFDVSGRLVKTLTDRDFGPGSHSVIWDGSDNRGARVATGIYLYRIETSGDVAAGKIMVR